MTPYADFLYFGLIALYVAVPTLIVRLITGFSQTWVLLATAFMLAVQFLAFPSERGEGAGRYEPAIALAVLAVVHWLVATGFLILRRRMNKRWPYYTALALIVLQLAIVKLIPVGRGMPLAYFAGIAYVTLRSLDVIFSIQDRIIVSLPAGQFLAFLFFFPTISSGPIDRYRRFADDWKRRHGREDLLTDLDGAVHLTFTGFLLKFILAALVERYWMSRVDPGVHGLGLLNTLSFMYAYGFYLFFDFAGYTCFAMGVSYLLGIHTPPNFNKPFVAHNIRDFWNRWHISLSSWLRDHIYMRFVLAATKGKWFKNRNTASYLGIFLAFGLMGVWHGIEAYYLIYGLYHSALLAGHEWFGRWNKQRKLWGDTWPWRLGGNLLTLQLVFMGFLLFSGKIGPHWR